jgi:hypothetical protein
MELSYGAVDIYNLILTLIHAKALIAVVKKRSAIRTFFSTTDYTASGI